MDKQKLLPAEAAKLNHPFPGLGIPGCRAGPANACPRRMSKVGEVVSLHFRLVVVTYVREEDPRFALGRGG